MGPTGWATGTDGSSAGGRSRVAVKVEIVKVPRHVFIGVDPGFTGAIAFLEDVEGEEYARVYDMPVHVPKREKNKRVDRDRVAHILRSEIGENSKPIAVVEMVAAMGGKKDKHGNRRREGAQSMFRFGQGQGEILGVLSGLKVFMFEILPGTWKAKAGLVSVSERDLCKRAAKLFPGIALFGPRGAPLHGRAEALFLAAYCRMLVERRAIDDR